MTSHPAIFCLPDDGPLGRAGAAPPELGPLPVHAESAILMVMGAVSICSAIQPDSHVANRDCLAVAAGITGCTHADPLNALVRVAAIRLAMACKAARPAAFKGILDRGELARLMAGMDQFQATCRDHWGNGPCQP